MSTDTDKVSLVSTQEAADKHAQGDAMGTCAKLGAVDYSSDIALLIELDFKEGAFVCVCVCV